MHCLSWGIWGQILWEVRHAKKINCIENTVRRCGKNLSPHYYTYVCSTKMSFFYRLIKQVKPVIRTVIVIPFFSQLSRCSGVRVVTTVTHGCQEAVVRSVSVPCGGRCSDRVTLLQANASAGSGHWGSCATSAWTGMCVDKLGSSVRLIHCFLHSITPHSLHCSFICLAFVCCLQVSF